MGRWQRKALTEGDLPQVSYLSARPPTASRRSPLPVTGEDHDYAEIGSEVVDLISDRATVELISCTPGRLDSFSKNSRS